MTRRRCHVLEWRARLGDPQAEQELLDNRPDAARWLPRRGQILARIRHLSAFGATERRLHALWGDFDRCTGGKS